MKRDSFIINRSFYSLIKLLPQRKRVVLYEAILDFGFDECEPVFEDDAQNAIWQGILPQLRANNKRYLNSLKGGAPVGNENAQKNNLETTEKQPRNNLENEKENEKKQEKENEKEQERSKEIERDKEREIKREKERENSPCAFINKSTPSLAEKTHLFKPPTQEEVQAYCEERENKVNARQFIDFYQSKGWMVGKNKMKDWRAAVRTWETRDKKENRQSEERIPYAN